MSFDRRAVTGGEQQHGVVALAEWCGAINSPQQPLYRGLLPHEWGRVDGGEPRKHDRLREIDLHDSLQAEIAEPAPQRRCVDRDRRPSKVMQRGKVLANHRRRQLVKLGDGSGRRQPLNEPAKCILKLIGRSSASMLTNEIEIGRNQRFVAQHAVKHEFTHRSPPIREAGRVRAVRHLEVMRAMRREYLASGEMISGLSSACSA
jgi:hypothetical protein